MAVGKDRGTDIEQEVFRMPKWEYVILDSLDLEKRLSIRGPGRKDIEKYLDVLGSRGWEIVNLDFRELDSRGSFTGVAKREVKKSAES